MTFMFSGAGPLQGPSPVSLNDNPFMTRKDMRASGPRIAGPLASQEPVSQGGFATKIDWANWAGMEVTAKMNELIAANGIEDPTAGECLLVAFGENARGKLRVLKVSKGDKSLEFHENKHLSNSFDLTPLFEDPSWERKERGVHEEAIDASDNLKDPIEAWILGYEPDGSRRIEKWNNDPNYVGIGPDGTLVDARRARAAKRRNANSMELPPDVDSLYERWFDAANTEHTSHQQMLANRYFRDLCAAVDKARADPRNPRASDIMWTNDPMVFPLPRELRAEGRAGLPPWEQGIMPYPPEQRQYYVPPRPKPDTYSIDVYISDWDNLFGGSTQKGAPSVAPGGVGRYRCICSTGTCSTSILETAVVDPYIHNGFHDWGRLEDYKMPGDYMLPDVLQVGAHPTRSLEHLSSAEQEEYGLTFHIVDDRGNIFAQGRAPPHMYYTWRELKGFKQFMSQTVRSCSKWIPVPMVTQGGHSSGRNVPAQGDPVLWVQVRVFAGLEAHKHEPGVMESFAHGAASSLASHSVKGQAQPAGAAQPWNLTSTPGDDVNVFGPDPGQKPKADPAAGQAGAVSQAPLPPPRAKPLEETDPWCRLTEFGHTTSELGFSVVFDTTDQEKSNCGRINKGELDNTYFVEALNAISCRPKLCKQLFYAWDVSKSIYVLRIMCNGTWVRVEIDDYVPPRLSETGGNDSKPSCCYSEFFPYVLWPSLVEKAYAKVHTVRPPYGNSGGWMALGGGGRVEEALADLTGGVAGRFSTQDASSDRLFIYFYHLQRHCIWVVRPHKSRCQKNGVVLAENAESGDGGFSAFVLNRAAAYQGETYVQIFTAGTSVHLDGAGLQTYSVPLGLMEQFPEKPGSGYFWIHMLDFSLYFDSVFECRLTSSPDVGLKGMPDFPIPMHLNIPVAPDSKSMGPNLFKEMVVANKGILTPANPPEFEIYLPGGACPCEITASLQQVNPRSDQMGSVRPLAQPLLLKVYQQAGAGGDYYSQDMVCKSNWLPVRDSMVSFSAKTGGRFLVTCGFASADAAVYTLIFRVYSSCDGVVVTARTAKKAHKVIAPGTEDESKAVMCSLVGCRAAHRSDESQPEPYNPLSDGLRVPLNTDDKGSCSVM